MYRLRVKLIVWISPQHWSGRLAGGSSWHLPSNHQGRCKILDITRPIAITKLAYCVANAHERHWNENVFFVSFSFNYISKRFNVLMCKNKLQSSDAPGSARAVSEFLLRCTGDMHAYTLVVITSRVYMYKCIWPTTRSKEQCATTLSLYLAPAAMTIHTKSALRSSSWCQRSCSQSRSQNQQC